MPALVMTVDTSLLIDRTESGSPVREIHNGPRVDQHQVSHTSLKPASPISRPTARRSPGDKTGTPLDYPTAVAFRAFGLTFARSARRSRHFTVFRSSKRSTRRRPRRLHSLIVTKKPANPVSAKPRPAHSAASSDNSPRSSNANSAKTNAVLRHLLYLGLAISHAGRDLLLGLGRHQQQNQTASFIADVRPRSCDPRAALLRIVDCARRAVGAGALPPTGGSDHKSACAATLSVSRRRLGCPRLTGCRRWRYGDHGVIHRCG